MLLQYVCERCGSALDEVWLDPRHEDLTLMRERVAAQVGDGWQIDTVCDACLDVMGLEPVDRGGD